jgi:hypothetical protein
MQTLQKILSVEILDEKHFKVIIDTEPRNIIHLAPELTVGASYKMLGFYLIFYANSYKK